MGPDKTQLPPAIGAADPQRSGIGSDVSDTSLSEAVAILRKRWWIWCLAGVLGASYGFYKAVTQPRLFQAESTIEVHNGASNAYRLDTSYDYGDDSQTKMNTEVYILQSDTLLETVAKEMDLANNPDFLGIPGPVQKRQSMSDPVVRANVVSELHGGLQVSLVARTQLIKISYVSLSPKLSADIVNHVVGAFIQRSFTAPEQQQELASSSLSDQLNILKDRVEKSQEEMMNLQRKLGVLGTDSKESQTQTSLGVLLSAEDTAKVERIRAESRYKMVEGMDPNAVEGSIEITPGTAPGELNSLRGQLAGVRAQYAQLTAPGGLGPNHPKIKALQDQINELTREITTEQDRVELQAKENYLATKAAEDKTGQEFEAQKKEAYDQGNDMVHLTVLTREYEQNRALYDGLQQRLETAKVEAGLDAVEVDTVDKAIPPLSPSLRPTPSIVLSTAVIFMLGGVVITFIVESLDTGLHNIQEIEGLMNMPSLAVIPKSKRSSAEQTATMSTAQRNINVLTQPKSQFTEAFRSLQTSLLLATAGHPPKVILFTSATPSEGKTTAATNLASVLSQGGARVLLIDADLRRPNVHHRFGLTGKLGLTSVLAGSSTLEEALQRVPEMPNLDILPSGPVPPFPTEMLSSESMHALLERFRATYSHIVIDSPPILSVTDAVILGRVVDAVVLVVRHGKSNKGVMRRTRDLLARSGAPMAGIVMNAVDLNSPEYYGYYGYSGYSYGSMDGDSWTQSNDKGESSAERTVKR
jgi:capsular exopolysaccharide synthesis family protein